LGVPGQKVIRFSSIVIFSSLGVFVDASHDGFVILSFQNINVIN
jgi:hypothetical protein